MEYEVYAAGERRLNNITLAVYLIQLVSLFTGFPALIGLIVNYIKLADVRGTPLESHFRWQIRTFWWMLLWSVVGTVLLLVLVGYLVLGAVWIWFAYRALRGLLALNDGKPMPA